MSWKINFLLTVKNTLILWTNWTCFSSYRFIASNKVWEKTGHCVLKMPKSQWRGAEPKFICYVKGDHKVISKSKLFFKSVQGNFWQFSESNSTRVPPCPSTWHEVAKRKAKILKKDPLSATLHLCGFSVFWW